MSRREPVYCCHACDTVFRESQSLAVLFCCGCGETFGDPPGGARKGVMWAEIEGKEYPEADDGDLCPACKKRHLEGGTGCPNCGLGGDHIGEVESCSCGHTRGMAPRTRRKSEPKGDQNER